MGKVNKAVLAKLIIFTIAFISLILASINAQVVVDVLMKMIIIQTFIYINIGILWLINVAIDENVIIRQQIKSHKVKQESKPISSTQQNNNDCGIDKRPIIEQLDEAYGKKYEPIAEQDKTEPM